MQPNNNDYDDTVVNADVTIVDHHFITTNIYVNVIQKKTLGIQCR